MRYIKLAILSAIERRLIYWLIYCIVSYCINTKIEFLLIGLKNQLAKIHNSSLDTSHCARNLGFIFHEHLTFSDHITALSKACYCHICQLRCNRPYLDSSTACTIATSIVYSKLDYCNSVAINSRSLNYPVSSRSRTLLLVLSWKLLSPVISLPSYAFFTGTGSLNASNTSSSHLPTKFSQLPNLHIFIISSQFNVLAVLALHPSLLLLGHLHHPL